MPLTCGNGAVDDGEECDDRRNGNPDDGCRDDCTYTCSNNDECDDGHPCTEDRCDVATHRCSHMLASGGTLCRASGGVCDVDELCDGSGLDCPGDAFIGRGTTCRSPAGSCDAEESCTGSAPACPADALMTRGEVCRPSSGVCDAEESCTGSDLGCPANAFSPSTGVCRAAAGACDAVERCTGSAGQCPGDSLAPSTLVCRPPAGVCDVAESCTGSGADCPSDGFRTTMDRCRAAAGVCDEQEVCTGSGVSCPADGFRSTALACRAAAGVCDEQEVCTGSAAPCPGESFTPAGVQCRSPEGLCDQEERCTGSSPSCPSNLYLPSITACRSSAGVCDVEERCTGSAPVCPPDAYLTGSTACRSSAGVCDGTEYCTGTSASCPADTLLASASLCRSSAGVCDVVERCTGSAADCPAEGFAPFTTTCRAASGSCDVGESCTGTSPACPANVVVPAGEPCDDGSYCTLLDGCDGAGACAGVRQDRLFGVGALSSGRYHTCALTSAGGVVCWGGNSDGQLGDGGATGRSTPVDVRGLSSGVSAVSGGTSHTCALTTAGGVKCWGDNQYGQLGDGSTTDRRTPVDVGGLTSGASVVSSGGAHSCAMTAAGGVKCWGYNHYGQLGDGSTENKSTPVEVSGLSSGVSAVSAGAYYTCALTAGGGVVCWGNNSYGQLGDGSTAGKPTPVQTFGLEAGVLAVTAGYGHTCALTTAGGVKCWGDGNYGQTGDGSTTDKLIPVGVTGLGSGVSAVVAGWYHTCAVTTGGVVKCWGRNNDGQLGDCGSTDGLTPVDVADLSAGASAVSAGGSHTCALTAAGGVQCWGSNSGAQLGLGSSADTRVPLDVHWLTSGVSAVSAGYEYTCALTTGGGVKCWGDNYLGQLGDGTRESTNSVVGVAGLSSGASAVSAGYEHTCALTTGGGAKCWGSNSNYQLGDGSYTLRSTPVGVSGLSSGASAVSPGRRHTCALTTGGG